MCNDKPAFAAVWRRISMILLGLMIAIPIKVQLSRAEVNEVKIAYQYGLVYLPLMVMQKEQLVEKQAARMGLGPVKAQYSVLSGGNTMNDALLSGSIHFAAGGVAPFLTLWGKTAGTPAEVKGVAGFTASNMYLLTNNPGVRNIREFTDRDRIAVPAVKVSIQALVLQMAAAQTFGDAEYAKLDPLTVAVPNPEAIAALLSGGTGTGINANFTAPPYSNEALANPKIKTVLTAYDVLGGSTVLDVIWATSKFRETNPKTFEAVLAAVKDAIAFINKNKTAAARIYIEMQGKSYTEKQVMDILNASNQGIPDVEFTVDPKRITKYSDFLHKTGRLPVRPSSWKDMFFPNAHDLAGS